MMGVMVAGKGMYAYLVRAGLGGGSNLACTCLYLTLLELVQQKQPIGAHINVLLDNTGAENKNNYMIYFLAWLVQRGVCDEASFFCMMVGHTYTELDQSFSTLLTQMGQVAMYTVKDMMDRIYQYLQPYDCRDVEDLHCLWDWKAFFAPHTGTLQGFGTNQFGSGMHEFLLRKDRNGQVMSASPRRTQHARTTPCTYACLFVNIGASLDAQIFSGNDVVARR